MIYPMKRRYMFFDDVDCIPIDFFSDVVVVVVAGEGERDGEGYLESRFGSAKAVTDRIRRMKKALRCMVC